jgi:hypothetical protein
VKARHDEVRRRITELEGYRMVMRNESDAVIASGAS